MNFLPTHRALRIVLLAGVLAVPALPSTVYSDLSSNCGGCGLGGTTVLATSFPVFATSDLTDVAARMGNVGGLSGITFSIYSNVSGLPGSVLTTLAGVIPDGTNPHYEGLVTGVAPTTPLTLVSGSVYWLAINLPTSNIYWEAAGTSSQSTAKFSGGWSLLAPNTLQFQIDGRALTSPTPEPGTLALVGGGIALAVLVRRRRLI